MDKGVNNNSMQMVIQSEVVATQIMETKMVAMDPTDKEEEQAGIIVSRLILVIHLTLVTDQMEDMDRTEDSAQTEWVGPRLARGAMLTQKN